MFFRRLSMYLVAFLALVAVSAGAKPESAQPIADFWKAYLGDVDDAWATRLAGTNAFQKTPNGLAEIRGVTDLLESRLGPVQTKVFIKASPEVVVKVRLSVLRLFVVLADFCFRDRKATNYVMCGGPSNLASATNLEKMLRSVRNAAKVPGLDDWIQRLALYAIDLVTPVGDAVVAHGLDVPRDELLRIFRKTMPAVTEAELEAFDAVPAPATTEVPEASPAGPTIAGLDFTSVTALGPKFTVESTVREAIASQGGFLLPEASFFRAVILMPTSGRIAPVPDLESGATLKTLGYLMKQKTAFEVATDARQLQECGFPEDVVAVGRTSASQGKLILFTKTGVSVARFTPKAVGPVEPYLCSVCKMRPRTTSRCYACVACEGEPGK